MRQGRSKSHSPPLEGWQAKPDGVVMLTFNPISFLTEVVRIPSLSSQEADCAHHIAQALSPFATRPFVDAFRSAVAEFHSDPEAFCSCDDGGSY
ncbi:MAG: hypothetical protein R2865_01370 [Deinococcales bacterium]